MKLRVIHGTFHVSLLKLYTEDHFGREPQPEPAGLFDHGHEEFALEKILSHRRKRGKLQYLIKWKGYPDHENTWEKTENLKTCDKIVQDYNASDDALHKGGGMCWSPHICLRRLPRLQGASLIGTVTSRPDTWITPITETATCSRISRVHLFVGTTLRAVHILERKNVELKCKKFPRRKISGRDRPAIWILRCAQQGDIA